MRIIGNPDHFAFKIGDYVSDNSTLRHVEIWAGGRQLCTDDQNVYVKSFIHCLKREALKSYGLELLDNHLREKSPEELANYIYSTRDPNSPTFNLGDDAIFWTFQFLNYGPTTDNICAFLFKSGSRATLTYFLSNEPILSGIDRAFTVVELDFENTIRAVKETIKALNEDWAKPSRIH